MTEHSSNDQFHASSFLQGHNAAYVDQLYARYANDPNAVDESWQRFFAELADEDTDVKREARGPSWARTDWPPTPNDDLTAALDGQWAEGPGPAKEKIAQKAAERGVSLSDDQIQRAVTDSLRALMIIRAYRIRGHLIADLDPLKLSEQTPHPELDPRTYGFTEADMDRPIFIDMVLGLEFASLREIIAILRRTYCGKIGVEFMHIQEPDQKAWIQEQVEGVSIEIPPEEQRHILGRLNAAEAFEANGTYKKRRPAGRKRAAVAIGE